MWDQPVTSLHSVCGDRRSTSVDSLDFSAFSLLDAESMKPGGGRKFRLSGAAELPPLLPALTGLLCKCSRYSLRSSPVLYDTADHLVALAGQ